MGGLKGRHLLVVDDETDVRESLEALLALEGYDVEIASGGAAALERVRKEHFDLVITDLKMPGMDGIQTMLALRELDPELRVIVATGFATEETARRCLHEGACACITKPFDLDDLLRVIEDSLHPGAAG